MMDPALNTLTETAQEIQSGALSPVTLTQNMLKRIADVDARLHSYVGVMAESALAQAQAAEREIAQGRSRGPLHGMPIAVKDLCFTKGVRTSVGAQMLADWAPDRDATVVQKLADAGAVNLGKLHMTEFALRWHHPYRPIPTNPWGGDRWPGVSSSGSGVAVAAGLCFGALGTDTGGSIRFPAAACGTVGLKPTYGRVSRAGVFPLAASLDHVGPLTRSVADAAIVLQAIAGYDPQDPTSSRLPVPDYLGMIDREIRGVRLGLDANFIQQGVHPDVSAAVDVALTQLEKLGAQLVEISVPEPDTTEAAQAWRTLTAADALVAHQGLYPERRAEYGPFRELLDNGAQQSSQEYAQAHMLREEFACRLAALFEQIDILVCPTMPTTAPRMDDQGNAILEAGYVRTRYTYPFNFSRNPTLSLPCGFDSQGLPVSLQFVGRHFEEALLCQVGHAYEQAADWRVAEKLPTL